MADAPLSPSSLLCFQLYSTNHAFNRFYQDILGPMGLTYPQYLVILALRRQDDQMVSALGDQLLLESNTLSPLLKRLEAVGLIRRTRSVADERKVIVSLTEQGRAVADEAIKVPACVGDILGLDPAELKKAGEMLIDLRSRLEKATKPAR